MALLRKMNRVEEGTGELLIITDDQLDPPIALRDMDGKMLHFHFVDNDGDDD